MAKKNEAPAATTPKCPITRAQFLKDAPPSIAVSIGGQTIIAERKEFSTGSLGYYANGKIAVDVNGVPVKLQVGLNLTVVGSKELPK